MGECQPVEAKAGSGHSTGACTHVYTQAANIYIGHLYIGHLYIGKPPQGGVSETKRPRDVPKHTGGVGKDAGHDR